MSSSQTGLVCLVVAEKTVEADLERIDCDRQFIDLVEIRADFLQADELLTIGSLPAATDLPLIFTLRRVSDGGQWAGPENKRKAILLQAAGAGFRYLDLESDVEFTDVERRCSETGTTIIRSLHDFTGVPGNLTNIVRGLPHHPGEIAKAAVAPGSTLDLIAIVETCRELRNQETLILGMGPWGFPTRILAGKLGSFLTFCSPGGLETAPGHVDPQTLTATYRYKSITPSTKVYCVIGNPVMHSRSPWIHNPGFEANGLDAVYIPVQVDDPKHFFDLIPLLDIQGASVTIPHKSAVRSFIASEDESVSAVGSCNTIFQRDGKFQGVNTDTDGFLIPLIALAGGRDALAKMGATVIGAGGAARAVVFALRRVGCRVCVVNRTVEKAEILANEFGCSWEALDKKSVDAILDHNDLIVQTTSVGMHPKLEGDPLPFYDFTGDEIVYDLIYTPAETSLLRRAKEARCRTLNGERMLLEQAYLQFKLFTGLDYPEECRSERVF